MEPDVYIHQDSAKSSWPYKKIFFALIVLAILVIGILIYLGLTFYKGKISLPFLDKIVKPSSTQSVPQSTPQPGLVQTKNDAYLSAELSYDLQSKTLTVIKISTIGEHLNYLAKKPQVIPGDFAYRISVSNQENIIVFEGWNLVTKEIAQLSSGKILIHIVTENRKGYTINLYLANNQLFWTHKI